MFLKIKLTLIVRLIQKFKNIHSEFEQWDAYLNEHNGKSRTTNCLMNKERFNVSRLKKVEITY